MGIKLSCSSHCDLVPAGGGTNRARDGTVKDSAMEPDPTPQNVTNFSAVLDATQPRS